MNRRPTTLQSWSARLRLALLLLVLAATGAQQLLAQTHWHAPSGAHASLAAPAEDSHGSTDSQCLLCQVASHGGAAAPPATLQLFTASRPAVVQPVYWDQAQVPAAPAHAWHSRGPPAA